MAFLLFFSPARRAVDQPFPRRGTRQPLLARIGEPHLIFWQEYPALLCSLSLLIGTSAPLFWGHLLWASVWCLYLIFCRAPLQIFLVAGAVFYGWHHQPPSLLPSETTAFFSPSSLQPHQSPFAKGLVYKGTLALETGSIPCSIYYRGEAQNRPLADRNYFVAGKLQQRGPHDFSFKPKQWEPVAKSWSLAEFRYRTKESFRKFLTEHLPSPRVAPFLSSLATGDVEGRLLRYEFGRLGLQHILGVSGFHFAILVVFCSFCLRQFLPRAWEIGALFLAVNAYFLFVGSSPAVQRSWLTALFYLLGQFLNRPTNGLNLLGCSLGVELICDPFISGNIGFQLSFLSCAGILLFHPLFDQKLRSLFPKRSMKEIRSLGLLSQHGYLLSSFFRQAISLTLSVNLVLLPILLFHFHLFPLLSLLYNLFFPFLVGVAMFALLLSLALAPLSPPLAKILFSATDFFTAQLLDLVSYPPLALDYSIGFQEFPAWIIPAFLLGLLMLCPYTQIT